MDVVIMLCLRNVFTQRSFDVGFLFEGFGHFVVLEQGVQLLLRVGIVQHCWREVWTRRRSTVNARLCNIEKKATLLFGLFYFYFP